MKEHYMRYTSDLAGSRTKNRFRVELLWGLDKIFTQYKQNKDFKVIFDYVCDIELHTTETFEFYQVKTSSKKQHTVAKLCERKKSKDIQVSSILGKLYSLRLEDEKNNAPTSKLAIVSNHALKELNSVTEYNVEIPFSELTKVQQEIIKKNLNNEFPEKSDICLDNIYYIKTDIPIENPHEILLGRTSYFFEETMNEELLRPKVLFNLLTDEIQSKACYEKSCQTYDELIEKKSLSGHKIEEILNRFTEKNKQITDLCKCEISTHITNFKNRIKWKESLKRMVYDLQNDEQRKSIELSILEKISEDKLQDSILETIDLLVDESNALFPIEYSTIDKKTLVLITLKKWEENMYE
ncbi:dsDNA nuclease domain-containing protein [Mycoplasma sp. P36-A1]|uniref:dsDNA nuclease domain-containing protein n=1 Tax=Mycoplasma sp. P36-A1 TaxID=3252900 RepID=UPI003C2E1646